MENTQNLVEGTLTLTAKGLGYVRSKERKESIEIEPTKLNTALQGDLVKVSVYPQKVGENEQGEIIGIITRSKAGHAGVLEKDGERYVVVPSDLKMYTDISIPNDKLGGAQPGQKVFAVISSWTDATKMPVGEITHVLGAPRENNAEMRAIALEKGFDSTFPKDVEDEAHALYTMPLDPAEEAARRDFRGVTTFTIDPFDAKDFDDALSYQALPDGTYEIGIHIADVSHYVQLDTALDREAKRRSTSVYLVDRTIPMLPEVLSNDLCSLKEHVDRLVFSAVFTFDKNFLMVNEWYGKGMIYSDKRFTYEDAQKILDDKAGLYYDELLTMNTLAKHLHKERFDNGAISLEQDEVKFILDANGVPIEVYRKVRGDTHKLVEELMLLANRKVAEHIAKKEKNIERLFVYRVHDTPDPDRIEDLVRFLNKIGYKVEVNEKGVIPSHELNKLIESLEGKEEKETVNTAIIRSMAKAVYSTKNIGHYGLAFKYYTHFTSPIRRYPDVIVHRLLFDYLRGIEVEPSRWHEYETLSVMCSYREKEASDAERASIKYKQVEYMSLRIGMTYEGVITGITDYGAFVEEKETKCEGLVRLKELGHDYFTFNEKENRIEGRATKQTFKIGDKVKIKVINADIQKKSIDYSIV